MTDRVAAGGVADREQLVAVPQLAEGGEVLPAGHRVGEIAVGEQEGHKVVDDAQPPGTLPPHGPRHEEVGGRAGVPEEEAAAEDDVDRRGGRAVEIGNGAPGGVAG